MRAEVSTYFKCMQAGILCVMKKRNVITISIFLVFYVSFGAYLYLNQEKIVYQPFAQDFNSCSDFSEAEKVTYRDTRMYIKKNGTEPVVVLYHGNAGSACDRAFYADLFAGAGYGYIIVEYAGYSNDTRISTHELVKQDVEHVVSYLKNQDVESVIIVGESIGTGVAAYHASVAPPDKLLLISPFTDLRAIARNRFWFYPTSILVDNAFNNVVALDKYRGVVTIIHGTKDTIIPHDLGSQLFQAIQANKKLVSIEGAGHNNLFRFEDTHKALGEFLNHQ